MGMKQGGKVELYIPIKEYITRVSGPETMSQIDTVLKYFCSTRDELHNLASQRNDSGALVKLMNAMKVYISMWSSISNCIPFGTQSVLKPLIFLEQYQSSIHMA